MKLKQNVIFSLIFLLGAVILGLTFQCPTPVICFLIYVFIGLALALFLPGSATLTSAVPHINFRLTGAIAIPVIIFVIDPINRYHIKPDYCDIVLTKTSVSVFVHGKSIQDLPLNEKGFVIMHDNGDIKKELINDKGRANFNGVHVGDHVRLSIDFSEPYKPLRPDSIYVIQPQSEIDLPIILQGIDNINGIVLYNDWPLAGVTVVVGTLKTTTDETGNFYLLIPESLQKQKYEVMFIKKGFKTQFDLATPELGIPMKIIMEKK